MALNVKHFYRSARTIAVSCDWRTRVHRPFAAVMSEIGANLSGWELDPDNASWINATNEDTYDIESYLLENWGPKHLPLDVVLPIIVVYVAIFVSGLVGNIAVCAVIIRNPSMHTATNCYLFSLAVSDLTVLLLGT